MLVYPRVFMNGDQGALNYVPTGGPRGPLRVGRKPIMRWPGHGLAGVGGGGQAGERRRRWSCTGPG